MNNRKLLALFVGLLMTTFLGATPVVFSANNDDLAVTCYGAYLEVDIGNTTWNIGYVAMSANYWTNETGHTQKAVTCNSTEGTYIDYEMNVVNATIWMINNSAIGANIVMFNVSNHTWDATAGGINVTLNLSYMDVQNNFDPNINCTFDIRFSSPSSTTTGTNQSFTLNGKVTVH